MVSSLHDREWSYDRALADLERIVGDARKNAQRVTEGLQQEQERIRNIQGSYAMACQISSMNRLSIGAETQQAVIWQRNLLAGAHAAQSAQNRYHALRKQHELLSQSKVFIIGPATIDSLMHWEPRDQENEDEIPNYDYLREGQLPFPAIYFEFFDPVKLQLPFNQGEREVLGMTLTDTQTLPLKIKGDNSGLRYALSLFYKIGKKVQPGLVIATNPDQQEIFLGSSEKTRFRVNMRDRIVEFDDHYDAIREHYPHRRPLDFEDEVKPLITVTNLATNLINYINAHNVYVQPSAHHRLHSSGVAPSPISKSRYNRPFYIVKVRDEQVMREDRPEQSRTLSCQFWVRGHARRYRNEDRSIRYVTWIPWHKKGPDGAPWKQHRWAISNEKIERELALMRELS